jgi:hypothetical protein
LGRKIFWRVKDAAGYSHLKEKGCTEMKEPNARRTCRLRKPACSSPIFLFGHQTHGSPHPIYMSIFDEKYRIISVEDNRLVVQGVQSGDVLAINPDPEIPLSEVDYPIGKLIVLSDPFDSLHN